jgi:uncharacterized membrane protein YcaP (DUF421 family)
LDICFLFSWSALLGADRENSSLPLSLYFGWPNVPARAQAPQLVFFMGGLTLTGLVGDDRSYVSALCLILSIAFTHWALSYLKQISPRVGRIIDGTPVVLLNKGPLQTKSMQKMGIQDEDIMAVARDQGIKSADQIDYAILERNGEISIVRKQEA